MQWSRLALHNHSSLYNGTAPNEHSILVIGMPTPTVQPLMGPTLETLLVTKTKDILFGSSLPASLPIAHDECHRDREPQAKVALEYDYFDKSGALLDQALRTLELQHR